MQRFISILIIYTALPILLFAQPRCNIRFYTVNDGLGSSLVTTMSQDKDGILWIGSWSGLSYFDGYGFMNLYNRNGEFGYPINNRVYLLRPGVNGGIWCITYDRKLYFFDTKTCKYTNVSETINGKFGLTEIRNIYPLENGITWVACYNPQRRLCRVSADLSKGEPFSADVVSDEYEKIFGKKDVKVNNVVLDEKGVEWIIADEGNFRADGKPSKPGEYKQIASEKKDEFVDSKGRQWKFPDDGTIVMTDKKAGNTGKVFSTGKVPQYTPSNKPLFVEDKHHTIWLASPNCVFSYYDEEKGELVPYLLDCWKQNNENFECINKYIIDSQSNIWLLGQHNVTCISPTYRHLQITETTRNIDVRSLIINEEGNLIAGSSDGTIKDVTANKEINTVDGKVYSLFRDSKGRQWVGTKGGGLFLKDGNNMQHFTNDPNDKYSLQGNDVYDIYEDKLHRIWVGCYDGGLNVYDEKTRKFINTTSGLAYSDKHSVKIRHITGTADGVVILSTADGIVAFDGKTQNVEQIKFHFYITDSDAESELKGGNVMQTLVTKDGSIYLSTMIGGLIKVKSGELLKDNLRFEQVESTQQSAGIVLSFIEYTDGTLWLARENRMECFDPKTGETTVFGEKYFGENVALTEALPVLNKKDGTISMGLLGGVVTFNPKSLLKSDDVPKIVFSSVQYQGEQQKQPILFTDELDVPSDKRNLTINFSALEYENNSLIRYAYKLEGDKEWNYVSEGHSASFHNLPCGHIKLFVKSTNSDGVWVENTEVLNIYSHPTFWETIWAKLLLLAIFAGIVYVAVYIVQMKHRHEMERKELEDRLEKLLLNIEMAKKESAEPEGNVQASSGSAEHSEQKEYKLQEVHVEPAESQFMTALMEFMEENISNSDLKVADISESLGFSRSVFYLNLKNITGMSPVDFIKYLRMQRAKQLMIDSDLSFSEIAYRVGFSDPNYFGKAFKKSVGMSPSEFREKNK